MKKKKNHKNHGIVQKISRLSETLKKANKHKNIRKLISSEFSELSLFQWKKKQRKEKKIDYK